MTTKRWESTYLGSESDEADDFRPTASWNAIRTRARLLKTIREYFWQWNFIEVETPILSADTVIDRHLDPISVTDTRVDCDGQSESRSAMWLQTSPEFHMKRLMASGGEAIYQITRVFRKGEQGKFHNPEFSMLEWYRAGDDMQSAISFLGELATVLLESDRYEALTYREVFETATGINPHSASAVEIVEALIAKKIDRPWSDDHPNRDDWLDLMFSELVQPGLGVDAPVIVYDWPASQAALAIVRHDRLPVAERFELFYLGIELANGYHELTDADELAKRNRSTNEQRQLDGKNQLPEESRLLKAMRSGVPGCAGVAMGVDRLLMILLESDDISEVIAFPFNRA